MLKQIIDAVLEKGIKISFKIYGGKKKKVESTDIKVKKFCYSNAAIGLNDISICDTINNEMVKNQCFYDMAAVYNDLSFCLKILNSAKQLECFAPKID